MHARCTGRVSHAGPVMSVNSKVGESPSRECRRASSSMREITSTDDRKCERLSHFTANAGLMGGARMCLTARWNDARISLRNAP
jgi:hypothetical protein